MALEGTRVRLCGRFAVEIAGQPIETRLRGAQSRALLAHLVVHRHRAVRRDELVEALWPGSPATGRSRSSLAVLLSRLRPVLEPAELRGRDELTLVLPEPVWVDVEVARRRVEEAGSRLAAGATADARAAAREAIELIGPGLAVDHDAAWVAELGAELGELLLQAREVLIRAALEAPDGSPAEAVRAARELVAAAPFRESAHLLLLRALELRGDVAEALRVYDDLRIRLREELGTAPGVAVRAAHAELLAAGADDAEPEGASAAPLPAPPLVSAAARRPFVGRGQPLGQLVAAWHAACERHVHAVVVSGEAGVGKTRLAEELARHVLADGGAVLYGRANEEAVAPYEPWIEALQRWERAAPRAQVERFVAAGLAPLLPAARPFGSGAGAPETDGDDHGRRFRLHEAARELLVELAHRAPLLVLLDDLHWADDPSIRLLRHLLQVGADAPLLVVGTLRTHDTPPHGLLTGTLADLARAGRLEHLDLAGLDRPAVSELICALRHRPASAELVREVHEVTQGNPFFVSEVVRHLEETGGRHAVGAPVPPGVRATISQRIARLDREVQRVLAVGAVLGREFDLDLVAELADRDEGVVLDLLERAVRAELLVERADGSGRHLFAHPLVRAVVYESLSATRRVRLHRLARTALERRVEGGGDAPLSELARHAVAAAPSGDVAQAVTWSRAAGEDAERQFAHSEAAAHYRHALELAGGLADADGARLMLLLDLGRALARSGDMTGARVELTRAAELAEARGDWPALARAALLFAGPDVERFGVVDDPAVELLDRALALVPEDARAERALLLARQAVALYFAAGQAGRIERLSRESLEVARASGAPAVLGLVLGRRHVALWDPDRLAERLDVSAEALALAERSGDREALVRALELRGLDLVECGDIPAARRVWAEHRRLAAVLRQPHMLLYAKVHETAEALADGRLGEAERLALEAVALGEDDVSDDAVQFHGVHLLCLRYEQDRLAELEAGVRGFVDAYPTIPGWRACLALCLAGTGALDAAREQVAVLAADDFARIPRDINFLATACWAADAVVRVADAGTARVLAAVLAPYGERFVPLGTVGAIWGCVDHHVGRLEAAAGRHDTARERLTCALARHRDAGMPTWAAWSARELAEVVGRSDPAQARALLDEARATARGCGLVRLERELDALRAAT